MAAPPVYPLKLSPNRRYLVDQRNVPFLIAGDSPQALMPTLSETEADRYFANRQAHGFNAAGWINVVSAPPCYPATHKDASTYDNIRPFRGFVAGGEDYAHYDLTEPNEAYFARLDHMIQLAAKHGIAVFLDPMETINWLPPCGTTARPPAPPMGNISEAVTRVSPTSSGFMATISPLGRTTPVTADWCKPWRRGSSPPTRGTCRRSS